MERVVLDLPPGVYWALRGHLLPEGTEVEKAAFVFARLMREGLGAAFRFLDWVPVESDGVKGESPHYLELTDESRSKVIKRAHDCGASLVEFHCHLGPWPATFSLSDKAGFEEFVPHVWWRLKGLPYAAVVLAPSGFDALCWLDAPTNPVRLHALMIGDRVVESTGLTLGYWEGVSSERPI